MYRICVLIFSEGLSCSGSCVLRGRDAVLDESRQIGVVLFQNWVEDICLPESVHALVRSFRFGRPRSLPILLTLHYLLLYASFCWDQECSWQTTWQLAHSLGNREDFGQELELFGDFRAAWTQQFDFRESFEIFPERLTLSQDLRWILMPAKTYRQ